MWTGADYVMQHSSKKSEIKTAFFVHATGFIGGAKNYEDALKMAEQSLDAL